MIDFIEEMCDSDEEFIAVGEYLNAVVSKSKNRLLYVPVNFSKQSKAVEHFKKLEKVIKKFTPNTAKTKVQSLIDEFGGYRMYVPIMEIFLRPMRDREIVRLREEGLTYLSLSKEFSMSQSGIRSIVERKKKTGNPLSRFRSHTPSHC